MPVLVLTARGSWHEKVQGIDGGADDYVAKPFRMEEVLARLRALIRRASGQVAPELRCGAVALDPRAARVTLQRHAGQADEPRVPRAVVPHAPPRAARVAGRADRAHLLAGLRSRLEHRRGVHRPAAAQARAPRSSRRCAGWATASGRTPDDAGPRRSRARVLLGAVLWTAGLFAAASVVLTQIMFHHPEAPRFFHNLFAHATTWSAIAIVCMIVGLVQVRSGLSAIDRLRLRLAAVHQGPRTPRRRHLPHRGAAARRRPQRCCSTTASRRSGARSREPATSRTA